MSIKIRNKKKGEYYMAFIRRLKDLKTKIDIYLVTKTSAVYDDNNKRLDHTLLEMNEAINSHENLLGGHKIESDVPPNAVFTDTVYTHPTSGVTSGTYKSVSVDKYGHVTGGTNPTTIDEFGITDALNKNGDAMAGFLTLHDDPTEPMHAATKKYVDNMALGLDVKASVRAASTGNLGVFAETNTSLTLSPPLITLDGVTLEVGDRILLKDQTNAKQNGIYIYMSPEYLERSEDANSNEKITSGMFTFVESGNAYANSGWVLTTDDPIMLGTSELIFVQFTGAGQIIAGPGIGKNGNILYIENTGVTAGTYRSVTVNERGQVTGGSNPTTLAGYGITDAAPSSHVGAGGNAHSTATQSNAGFMSAADKTKLDKATNSNTANTLVMRDANGNFSVNTITGNLSGNASTASKLATARSIVLDGDVSGSANFDGSQNVTINVTARKIALVGSDDAGTAGWYKVASKTMSTYDTSNILFAVTSTFGYYDAGLLLLQMRSDNGVLSCKKLVWLTRGQNLNPSHFIVVISGNTYTLYAYRNHSQHGRLMFEVLSESGTSIRSGGMTLYNSNTPESTAPTPTVTSSDGAYVQYANRLTTARTISLTGNVTGSASFDGSANININATVNGGTANKVQGPEYEISYNSTSKSIEFLFS